MSSEQKPKPVNPSNDEIGANFPEKEKARFYGLHAAIKLHLRINAVVMIDVRTKKIRYILGVERPDNPTLIAGPGLFTPIAELLSEEDAANLEFLE